MLNTSPAYIYTTYNDKKSKAGIEKS